MSENITKPTDTRVGTFLETVSATRGDEAYTLIRMMQEITHETPVIWGPSIIGFGMQHYKYDTEREGDVPRLGFSPRKAAITIYFNEGFDHYTSELAKLGKHKQSVSCLYINKLTDVDLTVLRKMLEQSFVVSSDSHSKVVNVDSYIASIPVAARPQFNELRRLVRKTLPQAKEVVSYGIIGYKTDDKRARVFISGWKDHVAMYPIPKDAALQEKLKPYTKGKGTLWFTLNSELPSKLIQRAILALVS